MPNSDHTQVEIEQAKALVNEYRSFFETAIDNQKAFTEFFSTHNQLDELAQYSELLFAALHKQYKIVTDLGKGMTRTASAVYEWRVQKNFDAVIEQSSDVCQFLLAHKEHAVLQLWKKYHERKVVEDRHEIIDDRYEIVEDECKGVDKKDFNKKLAELALKRDDLERRRDLKIGKKEYHKLHDAYEKAKALYTALDQAGRAYTTAQGYAEFKKACDTAIELARPTLSQHRGWKEILASIAQCVIELSQVLFNKKLTFFSVPTESSKLVDAIEESINELPKAGL